MKRTPSKNELARFVLGVIIVIIIVVVVILLLDDFTSHPEVYFTTYR